MKIYVRIDERLIHGQIAVLWSRVLKIDQIVVANEQVLKNSTEIMALKMAAPSGVTIVIKGLANTAKYLNSRITQKKRILVIVSTPHDALVLTRNLKLINTINLGNYGRVEISPAEERMKLSRDIYITKADKKILEDLLLMGVPVNIQCLPTDKAIRLETIL